MKPTIAKKIGLLLLLFNVTGVFALVTVSLLIGRRSNDDDLRFAMARQHRAARRLRDDLQSRFAESDFNSRIRRDVYSFDASLLEVEQVLNGSPSYGLDAAERRSVEDLRTKWSLLKASLLGRDFETRFPKEIEYSKAIKAQVSGLAEITKKREAAVRAASRRERNQTIFLVLLGACVLNGCLWLLGMWITKRSIVRPLQMLDSAVRSQQGGRLQQVPIISHDELGNLTRAFNDMSCNLETLLAENDRSAEALRASEARYRQLFDGNPSPMWVCDPATLAFLEVNQAALDHYGYSRAEFLSKTILDIRPGADVPEFLRILNSSGLPDSERVWRHQKRDGGVIHVRVAARDIVFESRPARLVVVDDVSEQRRLEEELRQAQKMEAVGRLSGGVAHDFNNILMVVSGHVALLLEEDLPPQALASVTEIQKAADRASGLTQQLLAFSRKQSIQPKIVNPNRIVKNACAMIGRLIGENIEVRTCLSADIAPFRVDPGEMEQVLMNLAINARDAMPNGGILTIKTETVLLKDHPEIPDRTFDSGPYVLVSVEDTGCGMDEATKSRIFDPFFTTKPVGRGTGLGLSSVYGIVKQSAGIIAVDSQPGEGTKFRIYLPSVDAQVEEARVAAQNPEAGSESILLVEDEDAVRDITAQGLQRLGYHVICAKNAGAAKQICAQHDTSIDVLLTDVIMPDMNGPQLARALKTVRPEMRVLFMSGYTHDSLMECGFSTESVDLINKPFTFDQLHRKLREVLDRDAAPNMVGDDVRSQV